MDPISPNTTPLTPPTPTGKENKGTERAVITVIAIVIIAAVGLYLYKMGDFGMEGNVPKVTNADEGEVISNFPKELILEAGITITESYNVDSYGVDQPVIRYKSAYSIEENLMLYRKHFEENGWTITTEADGTATTPGFLYAIRETEQVNATFIPTLDGIEANISYLK